MAMASTPPDTMTKADHESQMKMAAAYFRQTFGRVPIELNILTESIHKAGWPENAIIHPFDFLLLTRLVGQVNRDNTGPYFYLSSTKVRPTAAEKGSTLDLSDWTPPTVELATILER